MPDKSFPSRIPSLDGLRAISILMVVYCHLWEDLATHKHVVALRALAGTLGYLGVTVFFVISGFLITSLLLGEMLHSNRIHLARFYFRRTFRLLPPYYALIAVVSAGYLAAFVKVANFHNVLIHALTYTTNYNGQWFWYLGHSWSLSVEEQFYLLWPATLLVAGTRRGFYLAASLLFICPIVRSHYVLLSLAPTAPWNLQFRFEAVADALAIGCLLARLRPWLHKRRAYLAFLASKWFFLVPILVLVVNGYLTGLPRALVGDTFVILGIAACIDRSVTIRTGAATWLLNTRPMVFIGVISYSIYLWQQPFLDPVTNSAISRFPLNLLLVAIASLASYYLIERPSRRLRSSLESKLFTASAK
jgi:peptidoglycan/LPS O-acetylase OafA/YrhL